MSIEYEPIPTYTTREPAAADVPEIRAVHAASWVAAYPNDEAGVSYEWVKDRTDKWLLPENLANSIDYMGKIFEDPQQFYHVAEQDGKIVGMVHGSTKEDGSKYLAALYTLPKAFGKGLGKQLMDEFDTWADGEAATLEVASYNNRAIRFYEKYQFRKIPDSEGMHADRMPTFMMIRERNSEKEMEQRN